MKKFLSILFITFFALSLSAEIDGPRVGVSTNVDKDPEALKGIGVEENFGAHLNLDLMVTNEAGEKVALRTYFEQGRPVVINMVYYSCGGTCNALLTGSFMVLDELDWKPGEHFEMLNISFEPKENHILAQAKKANYLKQYSLEGTGIHFLTTTQEVADEITKTLGFKYKWVPSKENPDQGDYSHPSVSHVLTEEGKISRYLYGISFPARDYKFAITEAGEGKVGSFVERVLVFCFQYDKERGKYVRNAMRVMSLGGLLTLIILGTFLGVLWKSEFFKKNTQTEKL